MCGIAGILSAGGTADNAALAALRDALLHRGPDSSALYTDGPLGLAHTRLSIIDVATADQPLHGKDGLVLIGNGEIYNYVELRAAQSAEDNTAGLGDFGTLLPIIAAQGAAGVDAARGMYALAAYRPKGGGLILARDPFGIKPLYYVETDSGIAFASEPQALLRAKLAPRQAVPLGVVELLQMHANIGSDTIFAGIKRLRPGERMEVRGGRIVGRSVEPMLRQPPKKFSGSFDAAVAAFDATFEDSVRVHLRADVPYGFFLSGGIDSAALLTMAQRITGKPGKTFTCRFPETGAADESHAARKVATALGAEHTEIDFTEADFWRYLPRVAAACDDPTSDYATLPSIKLAEAARRHVKVVLTGEGGDEIFAGYGRYRRAVGPAWWRRAAKPVHGTFEGAGVLRDDSRAFAAASEAIRAPIAKADLTPLQRAQAIDLATRLPADLLLKVDRCLMAHGVEGRTPYLDKRMIDFGFSLPDRYKVRHRRGKYIVRQWLSEHCPAADAFARKQGFTVPVGDWMAKRGKELAQHVAAMPVIQEYCHADAVRQVFAGNSGKQRDMAWRLLFFAVWHRIHIEGRAVTDDAMELLAA